MKPSLIKIQKFFSLEADRGYDNHAVLGGLERILDRWEAEARLEDVPEELIQVVVERLRDYPRLTTASRAEVLEGLMRRIERISGEPSPKPVRREIRQAEESLRPLRKRADQEAQPAAGEMETTEDAIEKDEEAEESAQAPEAQVEPEAAPVKAELPAEQEDTPIAETAPRQESEPQESKVEPAALDAPVTVVPNIGPRHAQTLGRLGLQTLRDMLYYFPRRYDDYSKLKPINRLWYGEEVTVIGTVQSIKQRPIKGGAARIVEAVVSDGSGALRITWFNTWIVKRVRAGAQVVISGKVDQYLGRLVMTNPEIEPLDQQQLSTNRIVPVYPLTAQITQRWLRRVMNQVVTYWAPRLKDPLPLNLRRSAGLMDLTNALLQAHFPDSWDALKAARRRLAFDEIFLLQLGVLRQKRAWQDRTARRFNVEDAWLEGQLSRLPFPLTNVQQEAVKDVRADLASGRPMNRLLQGDVGSGKTVVAALAIGMIVQHGAQAAMMAPTSILAEQHYNSLQRLLAQPAPVLQWQSPEPGEALEKQPEERPSAGLNLAPPLLNSEQIRLMLGATPEAEKREIREGLADGSIKVVIGTHALIEEPVEFANLQLAVVDEQHRFGVEQRSALRAKGENPHLMVMTATPIPRSLALTVYGDLDLSVMDEMPPGRQEISTYVLPPRERERAYTLIRSQIEKGRQAFIIYPLVEESDKSDSKAAVEGHIHLQSEIFPRLRLGLLHGRMKAEEKDEVMQRFREGEYHILVSTSVIEVGVDVPNATVMLIEGANRFGLAQLHQFRGRVGRGAEKSYCLLIPETPDAVENERLQVMTETNDGFVLAEKDLEQRGPGQFLGTRQSGFSELQLASLTDVQLIEKARHEALALFEKDPDLKAPELQSLNAALERFWGDGKGDIS